MPARKVGPPRIKDALGWIEAVLEKELTGDDYALVIGKVVCAEQNDSYCDDGALAEPPMLMLGSHYRLTGESAGDVRETMKLFLNVAP
ncbi:MAG: hypothetical protein SWK76_12420 [Actinomycetota bacterium]|nr:hypothetical protein [Actinomycetota bacterium]